MARPGARQRLEPGRGRRKPSPFKHRLNGNVDLARQRLRAAASGENTLPSSIGSTKAPFIKMMAAPINHLSCATGPPKSGTVQFAFLFCRDAGSESGLALR